MNCLNLSAIFDISWHLVGYQAVTVHALLLSSTRQCARNIFKNLSKSIYRTHTNKYELTFCGVFGQVFPAEYVAHQPRALTFESFITANMRFADYKTYFYVIKNALWKRLQN